MFPRIQETTKKGITYEYLVISESIRTKGKGSTTKNLANLGNIKSFNTNYIQSLIDGFIKIFQLEQYDSTEDIEIIESLKFGSIIFWQKIWNDFKFIKFYSFKKQNAINFSCRKICRDYGYKQMSRSIKQIRNK
jgi:hypothetical protein